MPHIRPDCVEQSTPTFPVEHRRKPNSVAAKLTRDILLLRSAGSSRRAIAAALNLSQRRVQTILDGSALAVPTRRRPFEMRERDADYACVNAALRAGSTMRAEHLNYATRCPAPYSYSYFWRRFADWLDGQPDPQTALRSTLADRAVRQRATRSHDGLTTLRLQSEIRVSPANACPASAVAREDSELAEPPIAVDASEGSKGSERTGGAPLEGGLLFISEPDTALQIRKGALCVRYRDGVERTFPRGRHRLRSIMLASPGANVTIEAMRFAIDEGITIFVMHRAGEALAVLTDAPTVDASAHALELRRAQFAVNPKQRLEVARAILVMKIEACELLEGETQEALRNIVRAVSERTKSTGEKAFSKLKAHLPKIAERTVAGLMRALEARADFFKSAECTNYFAACGYDTT